MKKIFVTLCAVLMLLGIGGNAQALTTLSTINDGYIGSDDHGRGDVIGYVNDFGINSMDIEVNTDTGLMTVTVDTPFEEGEYFDQWITYGDLFISTDGWTPEGEAPYYGDNAATGTSWEYAFDVSAGKLVDLTGVAIQLSDDMPWVDPTPIYRNGQEVLVGDYGDNSIISENGSAGRDGDYYVMSFDVSALLALHQPEYKWALHWGMTCANDVIEGEFDPVPEPSTVFLLGAGLLGIVAAGRKRLKK